MDNPTADEIGTKLTQERHAAGLGLWPSPGDFRIAISQALRALGIPHSVARYDTAHMCLTCGESNRCPGVHTFEEIQEAARASSRDCTTRLSAFRVTYTDGDSYVTNMAAGVTLAEARAYFVGTRHTMNDEKTTKTVATVEEVTPHVN